MYLSTFRLALFFLFGWISQHAFAWGNLGHTAICEIAWQNIIPEFQQEIKTILGKSSYPSACVWPDAVRHDQRWRYTYDWHFINLNPLENYFEPSKHFLKQDILQGLLHNDDVLQTATDPAPLFESIAFISHLTGDVHQPLHVGYRSDIGGNSINIKWALSPDIVLEGDDQSPVVTSGQGELITYCYRKLTQDTIIIDSPDKAEGCDRVYQKENWINLHQVWDKFLSLEFLKRNISGTIKYYQRGKMYAELLNQKYSNYISAHKNEWEYDTYSDWMDESFQLRTKAYMVGLPQKSTFSTYYIVDENYYLHNIDDLNERLIAAGYRLAYNLNRLMAINPKLLANTHGNPNPDLDLAKSTLQMTNIASLKAKMEELIVKSKSL